MALATGSFIPFDPIMIIASGIRRGVTGVVDVHDLPPFHEPIVVMKQNVVGHESSLLQSGVMSFFRNQPRHGNQLNRIWPGLNEEEFVFRSVEL